MGFSDWPGQALTASKNALMKLGNSVTTHCARMLSGFSVLYALSWKRAYDLSAVAGRLAILWGGAVMVALLLSLLGCLVGFAPRLEPRLGMLGDATHLASLQQLLVSVGSALIGAAAIAFTLVMFAMQVNVDRMPYGLFRKLGSDLKLLAAFVGTFVLAIAVACLSLTVEQVGVARSLALTASGTILILLLFMYAYRRALILISPHEQLRIVARTSTAGLQRWAKRAQRIAPLLARAKEPQEPATPKLPFQADAERMAVFVANPHWTLDALQALEYAMAFARRFAERGDHEVTSAALNAIVAIHAGYVKAKGRTFIAEIFLVENPFTSDVFINQTLEALRQHVQAGLVKGDERQVQETFKALALLVQVYLRINYMQEGRTKTHAYLAAGYLSSAVQATAAHNMPDVLMEGIRLMGATAHNILGQAEPMALVSIAEKIALMAMVGVAKPDQLPVTNCGIEQLSRLAFSLIQATADQDQRFAIAEVRGDVFNVANVVIEHMKDTPLTGNHRNALAPYFSLTSMQSFAPLLAQLVNGLGGAPAESVQAQRVAGNLADWADGLFEPYKQLLLAAIAKRSSLTHELIAWASQVVELLLAASFAPACTGHDRDELRKSGLWLISTWSWIPDDRETVNYVERHRLADAIFSVAADAHRRVCAEVADAAFKLIVDRGFKAGRYETGWGSLETALCGAAALCLLGVASEAELLGAIDRQVSEREAPTVEIRFRAAERIREQAGSLYRHHHSLRDIDSALGHLDSTLLEPLLERVADQLVPELRQQQ